MNIRIGVIARGVACLLVMGGGGESSWGAEFKLKCLTDDGKIFGGNASNTCKNTLPKCSELKESIEKTTREQLSMKIYGYYKGYDVDLRKSDKKKMVGKQMPVQICSVVGHQIVYSGKRDLEFNVRNHGGSFPFRGDTQAINGAPCGSPPRVQLNGDDRKVILDFSGSDGSRWSSWMLGAMPYVIRANSHRFFQGFTEMSKLDSLLNSSLSKTLKEDYSSVSNDVEAYFKSLPEESKAACEDPGFQDLVDRCLKRPGAKEFAATEPALRTCEIVKTQLILNGGALSNLVLSEILEDSRAEYDAKIGTLLKSDNPGWKALLSKASEDTEWNDCWMSSKRKCGAVVISGIMGSGYYRVSEAFTGHESDSDLLRNRKGERFIAFFLDRSNPEAEVAWGPPPSGGGQRTKAWVHHRNWFETFLSFWLWEAELLKVLAAPDTFAAWGPSSVENLTLASGFPGLVEYTVRRQVCGQRSTKDASPQCSETAIPDKPAGVEW